MTKLIPAIGCALSTGCPIKKPVRPAAVRRRVSSWVSIIWLTVRRSASNNKMQKQLPPQNRAVQSCGIGKVSTAAMKVNGFDLRSYSIGALDPRPADSKYSTDLNKLPRR